MPELVRTTALACPVEVAFDTSLDLDVELAAGRRFGLRAVGGRTSGLIGLDETVTWQVRLGGAVPVRHTSRITQLQRPRWFVDEMQRGLFAAFRHEHRFEPVPGRGAGGLDSCLMHDRMSWRSPLGRLGRVADAVVVRRVLTRLLDDRNAEIARRCGRR